MNRNFSEFIQLAREYEQNLPGFYLPQEHPGDRPLAAWIDHTLLKPEAAPAQVESLCAEAREYEFASVCVNPLYVPLCSRALAGSRVLVCTVVGFPLGATLAPVKAEETRVTIEAGAQEVDMVIPVGLLKAGEYAAVAGDIQQVVETAHDLGAAVKVILEMALLTRFEKIMGCLLSQAAGAEFVKTSTGFGPGGATLQDVELMRRVVGPQMGVKAAGGVRTLADAQAMLRAGATRLGTSAGVKIMREAAEIKTAQQREVK
jgi:deoxyribose-phosphate aldolase